MKEGDTCWAATWDYEDCGKSATPQEAALLHVKRRQCISELAGDGRLFLVAQYRWTHRAPTEPGTGYWREVPGSQKDIRVRIVAEEIGKVQEGGR